ncbi:uncharacterized protein [Equus asinus]|uniref:uncharacterized protein n=1 Tax=Equus asinus TaxID=9793 RepID=UPI0038F72D03
MQVPYPSGVLGSLPWSEEESPRYDLTQHSLLYVYDIFHVFTPGTQGEISNSTLNKPAHPRRDQELLAPYAVPRLQPPEGTRPGPALRAHTRRALSPQGSPADPPARLCAHRPDARSRRRAALLGLLGAPAASAQAPCPRTRPRVALLEERPALGPGSGRFSSCSSNGTSAAFWTSRRAQRCSGWSDTSQRAAVTPDLRLPFPFSRGSPSLQALDSLCSFPVEESQGGLICFGRCKTMAELQDLRTLLFAGNVLPGRAIRGLGRTSCLQTSSATSQLHEMSCMQAHSCS